MPIQWDPDTPIYIQLHQQVVRRILDGHIAEGEPLPSVRKVAAEYQLNPITISKAYQMLQDENIVDKQRGKGVFQDSIKGLQKLNALGYGKSDLILNLVFNPQGAELPAPQDSLSKDYKKFILESLLEISSLVDSLNLLLVSDCDEVKS